MKLNTLYRASMESVENPVDEVPPVAVVTDGYVDQKVLEAKEAEAEATNSDATITRLMDIAEGLEAIALGIEAHRVNGLSQEAAFFANAAIGIHTKKLGLESHEDPRLGLESFSGSKAGHATRVTMEGLKETIAKVWEAIKQAIIKFTQEVSKFVDRLFDLAPILSEDAKRLLIGADVIGHQATGSFKNESISRKIAINGKVPANPVHELKLIEKIVDDFVGYAHASAKFSDDLGKFGLRLAKSEGTSFNSHLLEVYKYVPPQPSGLRDGQATAGFTVKDSEALPGDRLITMRWPKPSDDSGVEGAQKYAQHLASGVEFYLYSPLERKPSSENLPILSLQETKATAEACIHVFDKVAKFREDKRSLMSQRAGTTRTFDELAKSVEQAGQLEHGAQQTLTGLLRAYGSLSRQSDKAVAQVLGYAVETTRAFLSLAQHAGKAHYGKYEEAQKQKEAEAA